MKTQTTHGRAPGPVDAGANLVVHDLKNLASRLASLMQNLSERYDDPLFRDSALALLDDTAVHLRRLASDLRDHDGRVLIKFRVDVNQVLEDALSDSRPDLAKAVRVVKRCVPIPAIWGDAFLLRRAFACAIENALEAMHGQGVLLVRTSTVRRKGRERVVADIADDGPGMSASFIREQLFRPFSSTKEDGLGLGVYTIRQVAFLHGGTVRIESAEGVGTRVRFAFPVE